MRANSVIELRRPRRVVGLCLLIAAMTIGAVQAAPLKPDQPAAVVNGEAIAWKKVQALIDARPRTTPLTEAQRREAAEEALNVLIDDLLERQFLKQHAASVDPAEVAKHLTALEAGLKTQGKTVADYLKETGQTAEELKAELTQFIQMNAYLKAQADKLSPADWQKYFDENRDYFFRATVRASHIVIRPPAHATATDKDMIRKKLQALKADIQAGKMTFAQAAKTHSMSPTADQGGDIGTFARKWMHDEAFAKAAFALKVNEISDVVETEMGLHLIMVTERTPGTPTTLEQCQDDVRDCFVTEWKHRLLSDLRQKAQVTIHLP